MTRNLAKLLGLRTAVAAVLLACSLSNAHAALVERDLASAGDRLLTLDTQTKLEWLDLALTLDLSFNETLTSSFVTELGFRFATYDDMLGLYSNAGPSLGGSFANGPGVRMLVDLLGCTIQCDVGWPAGEGWVDLDDPTRTAYSFFQWHPAIDPSTGLYAEYGELSLSPFPFASRDASGGGTGSFLVRSVPEPATWALLLAGFGLAGAALRSRRRTLEGSAACAS